MPNQIASLYMNLPVPVVGVDPGPQYAIDVDSCLTIIDQHTHLPGSGVLIVSNAININTDLTFNDNNLIDARSIRFDPQVTPIPAAGLDLGCIYEAGGDLYYNDGAGNQIRITQSGGVAGTPGSISNLTPPASVSYQAIDATFVFQSAVNTPANLDAASIVLRNLVANSKGLTLSPPNAMGADYTITLPSLPVTTLPVVIDNAGNMSASAITFAQLDPAVQEIIYTAPTVQTFLTGSGTYTAPVSPAPLYIRVIMTGGGGGAGGGGVGSGAGNGSTGTDSTFGTSLLLATGGVNSVGGTGGDPGTASLGTGPVGVALSGGSGGSGLLPTGASGGSNPLGGGAGGRAATVPGRVAAANTGAGGGGGGATAFGQFNSGGGGGSSGYVNAIIYTPSATYPYSVGTGGAGGSGAAGGGNGGAGADGIIIVEEYYGS